MSDDKFISIEGIAKRYPNPSGGSTAVFEDLWLSMKRGEFSCIIGHSGCGKTTVLNVLAGLDDHRAFGRLVEAGEDVEHRGLAAAGVTDDAGELAALHRQPQVLEHGRRTAGRVRIALCDRLDGDELLVAHGYSGKVTIRVKRARIWSRIIPMTPMTRMAMITLVIDRLFHSFQTK